MSAQTPQLEIPIALDFGKARSDLEKFRESMKGATLQGEEMGRKTQGAIAGIGSALLDVGKHQGYQILKDAAAAIKDNFQESARYIADVAKEYLALRRDLQVVAALKGVANSGAFTSDQARTAKAAGLTPNESLEFQKAWLTAAGSFIGGEGAKISDADADKMQVALASFAKARAIPVEDVANVGGSILQFAEKMLTFDEAMKRVAGTFNAMEPAPGELGPLLSKSSQVMSLGASAEEAGQLMHLSTLVDKREGAAYIKQLILQLNEAARDPEKAAGLGISSSMGPLQKVKAAAGTVAGRAAAGENVDDVVAKYLSDGNAIVALGAMVRQGVQGGAFARVQDLVDKTPASYLEKQTADYRASDQGRQAQAEADYAANRVIAGEPYNRLERLKLDAAAKDVEEGYPTSWQKTFDSANFMVNRWINWSAGDNDEQRRLQRVRHDYYAEAVGRGLPDPSKGPATMADAQLWQEAQTGIATNANTLDLLRRIDQRLAEVVGNTAKAAAPKPLNVAPPSPRTRP